MTEILTKDDEQRLRDLASGLVRAIEEPEQVLTRCGFTMEDYAELSETRMFRAMLREAQEEWEGARNTHKRIKLKAAVNVEEALPHFYQAMTSEREPLTAKVKALEVVSRIAGLGVQEPAPAGAGQFFKLEINLGGDAQPLVLSSGMSGIPDGPTYTQSPLFDALPLEDL